MPSGLARKGCLLVQEIVGRLDLRPATIRRICLYIGLAWLLAMSALHLVPDRKVDGTAHSGLLTQ
jgi:hypothetical protein